MEWCYTKNEPQFNHFKNKKKAENKGFLTVSTKFSTENIILTPKKHYFSTLSTVKPVEKRVLLIRLQLGDNNTNCNYIVHNYVHKFVHTTPLNVHTITERIKNERNQQACNGNKTR